MVCKTDDSCALCTQDTEAIHHLLVQCPFSQDLWFNWPCRFGWEAASPSVQDRWFVVWWTAARKRIQKEDRSCFDSLVILLAWMHRKERNNRTFERSATTVLEALDWVVDEICAWYMAGFHRLEPVVSLLGRSAGRELVTV